MSEAVPLAHALLARLAELGGVRILFIKGPTAVALGARPPRPSTDVDVLCEPGGLERLGPPLERCGWRRRVPRSSVHELKHASKYLFEHSVHYIHDEWPCDIDIHFNFPGFFAPPAIVFETMWRQRELVHVANVLVPCPSNVGQAAIVGLHGLRQPKAPNNQADLTFLTHAYRTCDEKTRSSLAALAAETGCSDTLAPLLKDIGSEVRPSRWSSDEMLRRWELRAENEGIFTTPWLIELRHTPGLRKLGLIRRAMFLPSAELLARDIRSNPSVSNVMRMQFARWVRALRYLPRGLQAARRTERQAR